MAIPALQKQGLGAVVLAGKGKDTCVCVWFSKFRASRTPRKGKPGNFGAGDLAPFPRTPSCPAPAIHLTYCPHRAAFRMLALIFFFFTLTNSFQDFMSGTAFPTR